MALNTSPIYTGTPDIQFSGALNSGTIIGPSANTAQDGTGTNVFPVFQADATNGGFVQKIIVRAVGSPAATVMRVFVCNVTGAFTANTSNTATTSGLLQEAALAAVTLSQTAASPPVEIPVNLALPAGWRLFVTFGTSTGSAGTGYSVVSVGGKY